MFAIHFFFWLSPFSYFMGIFLYLHVLSFLIFFLFIFSVFCFPLNCIFTSFHSRFFLYILLLYHFCHFFYCFLCLVFFILQFLLFFLLLFLFCRFIVFFLDDYIFLHIFPSLSSTPSSSFSLLHSPFRFTFYYCSITWFPT